MKRNAMYPGTFDPITNGHHDLVRRRGGGLHEALRPALRLAAVRPGAVDRARQRMPEIPRTGDFGIPLRDEIDLTCPV